jgi:hypothetical protein
VDQTELRVLGKAVASPIGATDLLLATTRFAGGTPHPGGIPRNERLHRRQRDRQAVAVGPLDAIVRANVVRGCG